MVLTKMERLSDYPVVCDLTVQWGDQDPFNHVNNVVYLRWCETARISYLERIGLWNMLRNSGVGCILAHLGCNYRQPVAFPDTVHIGARVTKIGNSSFRMEHAIFSDVLGLVADAESTLVVYDYNLKQSCPMPEEIRVAIAALEESASSRSEA
jgi:acyl-CoA thioester hydrolase